MFAFLPGVPCVSAFRGYFNNVVFQTAFLGLFAIFCVLSWWNKVRNKVCMPPPCPLSPCPLSRVNMRVHVYVQFKLYKRCLFSTYYCVLNTPQIPRPHGSLTLFVVGARFALAAISRTICEGFRCAEYKTGDGGKVVCVVCVVRIVCVVCVVPWASYPLPPHFQPTSTQP